MKKLIPPDITQCQTMIRNKRSALSFGNNTEFIRCKNIPIAIITEIKEGHDGQKGQMSVCNECLEMAKKEYSNYFNVELLNNEEIIND